MLIITRRISETLMIGDDISLTVLEVKGNQVKLGVSAPKSVAVHREEVYRRLQSERADPLSIVNKKPGVSNQLSVEQKREAKSVETSILTRQRQRSRS